MRLAFTLIGAALLWLPIGAAAQSGGSAADNLPLIEYLLESLSVRGNAKTSQRFFDEYLALERGERVRVEELDRYRRRLLATGFFSQVEARLAEGSLPEHVIVEVEVVERNSILVSDVTLGTSLDTPMWGGLTIAETNLFGTGLMLSGGFVASPDQAGVQAALADPFAAIGLPLTWALEGHYRTANGQGTPDQGRGPEVEAQSFEYQAVAGTLTLGRRWRPEWSTDLWFRAEGLDFAFLDRTGPHPTTGIIPATSLLTVIGTRVEYDGTDSAPVPRTGFRAHLSLALADGALGSDYQFFQVQGGVESSHPLGSADTLRWEAQAGALVGADSAPHIAGFYVGDLSPFVPARALGLQFSDRRSLDLLSNGADLVTYGDGFASLSAEWAHSLSRDRSAEFFLRFGALGMRQGPWQIGRPPALISDREDANTDGFQTDLTFDLGFRASTPLGLFSLSVGNVISLLPLD